MKSSVKFSMLAVVAMLASAAGFSATAATMKLSSACEASYQKWKEHGGAKAFFATIDGAHCGYSYGRPNISVAIGWAVKSCNKYGKGEKCMELE